MGLIGKTSLQDFSEYRLRWSRQLVPGNRFVAAVPARTHQWHYKMFRERDDRCEWEKRQLTLHQPVLAVPVRFAQTDQQLGHFDLENHLQIV